MENNLEQQNLPLKVQFNYESAIHQTGLFRQAEDHTRKI